MTARNFGKDQNGLAIGPDSLLRVVSPQGKWKGWVVSYDVVHDLLILRDYTKVYERYIKPKYCTVMRPSDMDKARKLGQDRTLIYYSDKLRRRKLRSEVGR